MVSKNKVKKRLKRQKQFTTLEMKRFWGFDQFWQIILDKDPIFCFLCGQYIPPTYRDNRINKPYKNGDNCHESCWKPFMDMKHITERLNENSELICHYDLGWTVKPTICRMRVKNNPHAIRNHLISEHGWRLIPELKDKEVIDSLPEDYPTPKTRKLRLKKLQEVADSYIDDPVQWFYDNQLVWQEYRNIHFLRPNGKPFPQRRDE